MKSLLLPRKIWLTYYLILLSSWAMITISVFYLRPIQDDYLVLNSIVQSSIKKFLNSIWESQGGNLFPYAINAILLSPAVDQLNFIGIKLFYLFTLFAVSLASLMILSMVLNIKARVFGVANIIIYISIAMISFEGLFVPSYIGAFSFSLASVAHLWPLILMVFALNFYRNRPIFFPLALFLGFIIGNSNAGESFSALIIAAGLTIQLLFKKDIRSRSFLFSGALTLGVLAGFLMMIVSPGFSNRANNAVGFPSSISEFLHRLIKAFSSFFADSLSHPGAYLAFVFGLLIAAKLTQFIQPSNAMWNLKLAALGFLVLFCSLVAGGTLAYTSWHQAFGLQLLLAPLMFALGVLVREKFDVISDSLIPKVFLILALLVSLVLIRTSISVVQRAQNWDAAFISNTCSIRNDLKGDLKGAELRYPPFNLGIEDIDSWEWMRVNYIEWVKGLKEFQTTSCD